MPQASIKCHRETHGSSETNIAIPEAQLITWSRPGATENSIVSYNSVKTALTSPQSLVLHRRPEIYLQGSYRNATNIHGDSDVDVVVELQSIFYKDVSQLDAAQINLQAGAYGPPEITFEAFKGEVLRTLQHYYGNARVRPRDRCIKVDFGPGRITADVVPAFLHRRYTFFYGAAEHLHAKVDGIQFQDNNGVPIVNFPKQHIENGQRKNSVNRTGERFKPTVRVFKNIRNRLIGDRQIGEDVAPSYFIEGLLYNADDACFVPSFQTTFGNIISNLGPKTPNTFMCQNGIILLFGNLPVQWNTAAAVLFLTAAQSLWNNWR